MNEEQETGGATTRERSTSSLRLVLRGSDTVFCSGLIGALAAMWLLDGWGDLWGWVLVVAALILASFFAPISQRWLGDRDEGGPLFSYKSRRRW